MLNTRKLLYILPDVAYVAELLPTKKEHTFAIQAFRQINGEFLNEDDDLIAENIEKLFSKIEPETYHLVLPDFLFTNTILEIKETQESKVKQYIKETLLPSLNLSKDTHEIETFILTQYGNTSKIQLTALEKEVVAPVAQSAANHKVQIDHISPLSWTIKSVISLEPSISVIQIGSTLFTAEHYIGVDQCTMAKVDEIENVSETVKTLKGAQPSIQTIYLMTNNLVEEKLKELVSSTLPVQQLAAFKEEDSQMPSYVKQIIESGMKTLDISDYPVPSFDLPKVEAATVAVVAEGEPEDMPSEKEKPRALDVFDDETEVEETTKETVVEETESKETEAMGELPAPTPVPELEAPEPITSLEASSEEEVIKDEAAETPTTSTEFEEPEEIEEPEELAIETTQSEIVKEVAEVSPMASSSSTPEMPVSPPPKAPVIRNRGNSAWVKMLITFLTVFIVTVAAGAGLTYLVLRVTGQIETSQSPTTSPTPSPTAEPSPLPSPSPSPAIERGELSILVVNATTKPGYAGGTRTKLQDAGYGTVQAANAKGDYEPGIYVLMPEENAALVSALSTDSGLSLTYETGFDAEDPKGEYDAVIVLAE